MSALSTPILGYARNASHCNGTFDTIMAGLQRLNPRLTGCRMLDIGCGSGFFTVPLGEHFEEVHGVDVDAANIEQFLTIAEPKHFPLLINASTLPYPSGHFDSVVSIETLEHVDDLKGVCNEAVRVLRSGGELLITVPNRWYPVEGHGGTIRGKFYGRIPLITWFPSVHKRIARARVFTVADLDNLFPKLTRSTVAYCWPTFEHGGGGSIIHAKVQAMRGTLYPMMRQLEVSPIRFFGCSVVVRYVKP